MAYYVLWSGSMYPGEDTRDLEGGAWGGLEAGAFLDGKKLLPEPIVPIEIDVFPEDEGEMPPLFVVPALVVRRDFAQVLQEAGVDNIDYYPAVILDRQRGAKWDDYLVGNVVGLMDVVDMERSVVSPDSPPGVAMLFETMVINEQKCRGQKLFRLSARPGLILVSDDLRKHVQRRQFKYVHFIPPEEFA